MDGIRVIKRFGYWVLHVPLKYEPEVHKWFLETVLSSPNFSVKSYEPSQSWKYTDFHVYDEKLIILATLRWV